MTKLRKRWNEFLCWFDAHKMVVVARDVDWCVTDTLRRCERCGFSPGWKRVMDRKG